MKKKIFWPVLLLGLFYLVGAPAWGVTVKKVTATTLADRTAIEIQLDDRAFHGITFFENKLIIEIDGALFFFPTQKLDFSDARVSQIKIAQFTKKPPVVRVVIDLKRAAGPASYRNLTASGDKTIKLEILTPAASNKTENTRTEAQAAVQAAVKTTAAVSRVVTKAAKPLAAAAVKTGADELTVTAGQSITLEPRQSITNIAVGDPGVADFVVISAREVLINGKREGTTSLTVWHAGGKKNYQVIVTKVPSYYVTKNLKLSHIKLETSQFANDVVTNKTDEAMVGELDRMLSSAIGKDKYSINTRLATITVQGSPADIAAVENLLNKIDVPRRQVIIEARVLEIKKTVGQEIGLTWIGQSGRTISSFSTSSTSPPKIYDKYPKVPGINPETGQTGVQINPTTGQPETVPSPTKVGETVPKTYPPVINPLPAIIDDSYVLNSATPISALGAGGGIIYDSRSTAASVLMAQLSALETDNKAKLLANPKLATLDGQTSIILIGQKVPVIQRTSDSVTVQYIDIGVKLAITPRVGVGGEILTWLRTEASGIVGYQEGYPLISSREAQAEVRLKDGQTLVIGGLLQKDDSKIDTKVPLLGDLPIVGFLFRGKKDSTTDTEILITITPHLMKE